MKASTRRNTRDNKAMTPQKGGMEWWVRKGDKYANIRAQTKNAIKDKTVYPTIFAGLKEGNQLILKIVDFS